MAQNKNILTGEVTVTVDKVVTIELSRYEELIKKEALLKKLMEGKGVNVYLYQKVEEEIK